MAELKGLSILIPIYNYDARHLVLELRKQASELNQPFEILCYDDGSSPETRKINQELNQTEKIIYKELPENIGRSAIRNKLAKEALYSHLVLLDCNVAIVRNDFLKKYIELTARSKVIIGGSLYDFVSDKSSSLRWKYGKIREALPAQDRETHPYRCVTLKNIFIEKLTYLDNPLDETIKTYGHEDTKFAAVLKEKKISVLHIDNPVRHAQLDTNPVFIEKTLEGVKNFYKLIREGYASESKLYKTYILFKHFPLKQIFMIFYSIMESGIRRNLLSGNPSLFYFDLMKLRALLNERDKIS
jgi:glycosyltransferase involved in cell wall biosynthesis